MKKHDKRENRKRIARIKTRGITRKGFFSIKVFQRIYGKYQPVCNFT